MSEFAHLNQRDASVGDPAPPFDPLRLCVYTTVALLTVVLGPIALLAFSSLAIAGYAKARRRGLLRSRCKLGDTRLVLAYLAVVAVAAAVATPFWVAFWVQWWT
ncbi:hypothetical protein ACH3VR_18740 [Microbacterium sp. B2969]|uniref:DUF4190 domain-containing protein n=1 Tax=Microbacterium alkaliflavum TaxID=3248839 RepID=A0ABW7QBZ5_9MICO